MTRWIIGSGGYIAKQLLQRDNTAGSVKKVSSRPGVDSIFLDLANAENFQYDLIREDDEIVFLAAVSSPDICENQPEYAYDLNVKGTGHFIEQALNRHSKVLFFSSDTVYGRQDQTVDELSSVQPLGNYAAMKREIELKFLDRDGFKIFRLSYVFSQDDKFTRYINNCSNTGQAAVIFHPFYRSIVFIEDVLDAIDSVFQKWGQMKTKIINVCGSELLSRVDLATCYKEMINHDFNFEVVEPPPSYFDARPQVIHMKSLLLEELLGRKPITIKQAMLKEFKKINWGDKL